jgi:2-amino-4-hydroxy-6-hydroxymethyldihydropteridine diphosphokinase
LPERAAPAPPFPVRVAVALGSNLGDRRAHLEYAHRRLERILSGLRHSPLIDTEPEGGAAQPRYLNGACTGETRLPARALLAALLAIEGERGRERPHAGAPRTLDLDVILYGDQVIDEPGLQVPHPRFRHRRFVLEPLAVIAGDWVDPVTRLTIAALLARLNASQTP